MSWMVFYNHASGGREFGYYDDEEEARESMEDAVQQYRKLGVAVEVGIAEIVETVMLNWND